MQELRGKALLCHCRPGQPCHGDVLVEMLEATADKAESGGEMPVETLEEAKGEDVSLKRG